MRALYASLVLLCVALTAHGQNVDEFRLRIIEVLSQGDSVVSAKLDNLRRENTIFFDESVVEIINSRIYTPKSKSNVGLRYTGLSDDTTKILLSYALRNKIRVGALSQIIRNLISLEKSGELYGADEALWVHGEIIGSDMLNSAQLLRLVLFAFDGQHRLEIYKKINTDFESSGKELRCLSDLLRPILKQEKDEMCLDYLTKIYSRYGLNLEDEISASHEENQRHSDIKVRSVPLDAKQADAYSELRYKSLDRMRISEHLKSKEPASIVSVALYPSNILLIIGLLLWASAIIVFLSKRGPKARATLCL